MKKFGERLYASIGTASASERKKLIQKYGQVELRSDLCSYTPDSLLKDLELARSLSKKAIVAIRECESLREIEALMVAAMQGGAEYIDLDFEIAQKAVLLRTKGLKRKETTLIVSYHNFSKTPSLSYLKKIADKCFILGAKISENLLGVAASRKCIVKIATQVSNSPKAIEEAQRVLQLYFNPLLVDNTHLIAFAMGEEASFTRICALNYGAPLMYCTAKEAVAHGQKSYQEMVSELDPEPNHLVKDLLSNKREGVIGASKSLAQRALLMAAYSSGNFVLKNFLPEGGTFKDLPTDTLSALKFAEATGATISRIKGTNSVTICSKGFSKWNKLTEFNCGESGFLARCFIALGGATGKKITVTGSGTLLKRDFSSSVKIVRENGGKCSYTTRPDGKITLPITIEKGVSSPSIVIDGSSTSQDISGYLMAQTLRKGGGDVIASNTVSNSYIGLTQNVIDSFKREGEFFIDNDWSSAANLLVAAALESSFYNGRIVPAVKRMRLNSDQGDELIIKVLTQCGCTLTFWTSDPITSNGEELYDISVSAKRLSGFSVDCTDAPDLIPILYTLAYFCDHECIIKGMHRLINKESNRAASILIEMSRLHSQQTAFSAHNDHRIAMAVIVLLHQIMREQKGSAKVYTIDNIECIRKSFPQFI